MCAAGCGALRDVACRCGPCVVAPLSTRAAMRSGTVTLSRGGALRPNTADAALRRHHSDRAQRRCGGRGRATAVPRPGSTGGSAFQPTLGAPSEAAEGRIGRGKRRRLTRDSAVRLHGGRPLPLCAVRAVQRSVGERVGGDDSGAEARRRERIRLRGTRTAVAEAAVLTAALLLRLLLHLILLHRTAAVVWEKSPESGSAEHECAVLLRVLVLVLLLLQRLCVCALRVVQVAWIARQCSQQRSERARLHQLRARSSVHAQQSL